MKTQQPEWVFVANIGDASPLEHGGTFIYVDRTGVYSPEVCLIDPPEEAVDFPMNGRKADPERDEDTALERKPEDIRPLFKTTVHRFIIAPCTFQNGILSDNKFHPDHPAWFAHPEARKAERPQDSTYLSNIAEFVGVTIEELASMFTSPNVMDRAWAWIFVGEYHGMENLDEHPLHLTEAEAEERFAKDVELAGTIHRDHKVYRPVWAHHPRGGIVSGVASMPYDGLYGVERRIATTVEAAALGLGMSFPDKHVILGEKEESK